MDIQIADIVNDSVVDGTGIRMTIFTQGCPHRCPGCHNPTTHPFEGGYTFSVDELFKRVCKNPLLDGITLSGGEPFVWAAPLAELARRVRAEGLNVWCYTGYTLDELEETAATDEHVRALLNEIDVLVDGRFVLEERDLTLLFRGSRNQRIIDMNRTRAAGAVVLWENE